MCWRDGMTISRCAKAQGMSNGSPDYYWLQTKPGLPTAATPRPERNWCPSIQRVGAMTDSSNVLHDRPFPLSGYELDYATGKGFLSLNWLKIKSLTPLSAHSHADAVWNNRLQPDNQFYSIGIRKESFPWRAGG